MPSLLRCKDVGQLVSNFDPNESDGGRFVLYFDCNYCEPGRSGLASDALEDVKSICIAKFGENLVEASVHIVSVMHL